jgi:hypothetical protein
MSDEIPYYQIDEPARGARFYNGTTTIGIQANLTIESSATLSGGVLRVATVNSITGNASTSATVIKLISGAASLSGSASVSENAIEILKLISYISGSATVQSGSMAIRKGVSSQSGSATTSFSASRRKTAQASASGSVNVSVSAGKIVSVSASFLQAATTSFTYSLIRFIDPSDILITSRLKLVDAIRFTTSNGSQPRYPGSLLSMILLDGKPLTAQGRKFSNNFVAKNIEKKNWNNTKSRYYMGSKAGKESFKISWEWLPADNEDTIDNRFARNYIKQIAMDPDVHQLKILSYGTNPEDVFQESTYNVFVGSYSEDLVRRDLSAGVYLWRCDLTLEEA